MKYDIYTKILLRNYTKHTIKMLARVKIKTVIKINLLLIIIIIKVKIL